MNKSAFYSAVAAVLAIGLATPAHALITRAWVSGKGVDAAGCGAPTNACRTFQYVLSNILAPGGEIDVLDPAGYGPMTINFAVRIINDGVGTAGVQQATAGQNAITINAGPNDKINLKGLTIEGLGVAQNGIQFNSGNVLRLMGLSIANFAGVGVNFVPNNGSGANSFLIISGGSIGGNGGGQVVNRPSGGTNGYANLQDHCTLVRGPIGITVDGSASSAGKAQTTISHCTIEFSSAVAVEASGEAAVMIDESALLNNTTTLSADGANALIALNASFIEGAATISSTSNGAIIATFSNNGVVGYGTFGTAFSPQPLH